MGISVQGIQPMVPVGPAPTSSSLLLRPSTPGARAARRGPEAGPGAKRPKTHKDPSRQSALPTVVILAMPSVKQAPTSDLLS